MLDSAVDFANRYTEVELVVDPPRVEIHRALRQASLVVLLSQRGARWREQVGLPIVEALAHGCQVLTTDETGLAQWLTDHGHQVVDGSSDSFAVAQAMVEGIGSGRERASVLADLPSVDGRSSADAWLHAGDACQVDGLSAELDRSELKEGQDGAMTEDPAHPSLARNVWARRALGLLRPTERQRLIRKSYERTRGWMRGQSGAQIARGAKLTGPGTYILGRGSRIKEDARLFVAKGAVLRRGTARRSGSVIS